MEHTNQDWNYKKPSEWSKYFPHANGLCQSPININIDEIIPRFYPSFYFSPEYFKENLFNLSNNGNQIIATLVKPNSTRYKNDLWLTGGGLNGPYHFVNFHLHWGQNDKQGSEHQINGHPYAAEAHFVHRNIENGKTAVLAVFLIISDSGYNDWDKFAYDASRLGRIHETNNCIYNLSKLIKISDREFFQYMGSLTTPPCTEGILWTVFNHKMCIRTESLNLLRQNIMENSYRPVQSINNRPVFKNNHS